MPLGLYRLVVWSMVAQIYFLHKMALWVRLFSLWLWSKIMHSPLSAVASKYRSWKERKVWFSHEFSLSYFTIGIWDRLNSDASSSLWDQGSRKKKNQINQVHSWSLSSRCIHWYYDCRRGLFPSIDCLPTATLLDGRWGVESPGTTKHSPKRSDIANF